MTNEEHIKYWITGAESDLTSAVIMLNAGRYNWCLNIGHLVLEKIPKALFVQNTLERIPPKTHNLLRLAEISNKTLTSEQSKLLLDINKFQIEGRYPEQKEEISKLAQQEFTLAYFEKIKEQYLWLKSLIKYQKL